MDVSNAQLIESVFGGGSEMAARMRSFDWSTTPLGTPKHWQQSLRICVRIVLGSGYPMCIHWGPDYTLLYNDQYLPLLGTKHPMALGRGSRDVVPEAWDFIGPVFEGIMGQGQAFSTLTDYLVPLNRNNYLEACYFALSFSPIPDDKGGVGGVLGTALETTERVIEDRRRQLLRDLASRTAQALNEQQIWRVTAKTLGEHPLSVPFAFLYQYQPSERRAYLAGASVETDDALHPELIDCNTENLWRFDSAIPRDGVVVGLGKCASGLLVPNWQGPPKEASVVPIPLGEHSEPAGFLVLGIHPGRAFDDAHRQFVRQIADQIALGLASARAYEQERRRAEALAELDRAKTAFFSNVSHEFRTPLTLMLGPLEEVLPEARKGLGPQGHEQLVTVRRNALRLLKLVNTLLDFSRIEAGRVQAVYEPIDLASVTSEIASAFRSAIETAGLRFSVKCHPIAESIYVDRDMWEKVVLNLLSNAFKFTFEGEVAVTLKPVDGAAELQVRDTGVGIPEEHRDRVFERFHRIEGTRARTYEGTGIGLALVQELVKLHGGDVRVESVVDQGSTFTVTIPRGLAHLPRERIQATRSLASTAVAAEAYAEEALRWLPKDWAPQAPTETIPKAVSLARLSYSEAAPKHERELIIVADDNADMRQFLKRLLDDRYEVHLAADGREALELTRGLRPGLVLADVMMPQLDGFALLQAIRKDSALASTPVILVSARAGEESRVEGLQAGADDYLVKPFSVRELLARVEANLKMITLRRETAEREERLRSEAELEREKLRASEERLAETNRLYRELQNHEAKIRRLVEANIVGIAVGNVEGRILETNDAFLRIVGYDREDLASGHLCWTDLTPPEWRDRDEAAIAQLNANGVFQPFEKEYFRKDGSRVPVLQGGALFEGSENEGVAFILDLSEQKRAEKALRHSEERWRSVFENSAIGVALSDLNGRFIATNPVYQKMLGYTGEELQNLTFLDITVEEFRDPNRSLIGDLLERKVQQFQIEKQYRRKDGSLVWVHNNVSVVPGTERVPQFLMALSEDITERKRVEEALRASEQEFRLIVDTIPGMVCMLKADWGVEFVNQPLREYFGMTLEELKNWEFIGVVHPEDIQRVLAKTRHSAATGEPYDVEHRCLRHDGVFRWFQVRAMPLRDTAGHIARWYLLLTDIEDRKRAEEALQGRERNLSLIINTMPVLAWSARPDGSAEFLSQRWLEYTGFSAEQAKDWGWTAALHRDDGEGLLKIWQSSLVSGAPLEAEARMRRFDGAYRWLLFRTSALRDESGNIVKWYGTAVDIEDRKQAEQKLRRNEWNLLEAQRLGRSGSWSLDVASGTVTTTPEIFRTFDVRPGEDTSNPDFWFGRIHHEDRKWVRELFEKCLAEKTDYDAVYRLVCHDGSIRHQHSIGRPIVNDSGDVVEFMGAAIDITEQVEARDALLKAFAELRHSEESLRLQLGVLQYMPAAAWTVLPNGTADFANEQWLEYAGQTLDDIRSSAEAWMTALHPDDRERAGAIFWEGIRSGRGFTMEARFRRISDGEYRWHLNRAIPLRDPGGNLIKFVGTSTDIQDVKRAEEALQSTQAQLAHVTRVASMGEIAASIAHEVNQPLSGVIVNATACLNWLAANPPNLVEVRETVQRIARDGQRAGDVIARIRALATKKTIEKERLDLNQAIQEIIALVQGLMRRHKVILRMDLSEDLPAVLGDRIQLQQVVLNLVVNAIEAMAKESGLKELAIATRAFPDGIVQVAVCDSGRGLDAESMQKVFEAFYTTKPDGMGMGLSISRTIVRNHSGRLWVTRNDGPGATFYFTVPKSQ